MSEFLQTLESIAGSVGTGGVAGQIAGLLARRPVWIAQLAARELALGTGSTAPLWRWVRISGPVSNVAVRGSSVAATVSGTGGLAVTLGIPIVVAVGTWVMLGAGYYEARKIVRQRAFMSGFSQGFVMGVLKWQWSHAVNGFAKRHVIRTNTFDGVADREEAEGYNEGLHKGFGVGEAAESTFYHGPEHHQSPVVKRVAENAKPSPTSPAGLAPSVTVPVGKNYRIALRKLAGRTDSGPWSKDWDEARLQQRNYVIDMASAGLKHGLIVPE